MLLAKIISRDDGETISEEDQVWCLVTPYADGPQTFCGGEYFGAGESAAQVETKRAKRGGITCATCLNNIREIKAVKI